jgi:hypothetical protein
MGASKQILPESGSRGGIHMKKLLVPLAVMLLLALAVPAAFAAPSQIELGMSWVPYQNVNDPAVSDYITGFHVGYAWYILYAAWDALALPGSYVATYTAYDVPAFLNLFDGGLRLVIGPFVGYTTVGTNLLHVYGIGNLPGFGANVKVGLGLKFGWWGFGAYLIRPYAAWDEMTGDVAALFSSDGRIRNHAVGNIFDRTKIVPGINLTFYF